MAPLKVSGTTGPLQPANVCLGFLEPLGCGCRAPGWRAGLHLCPGGSVSTVWVTRTSTAGEWGAGHCPNPTPATGVEMCAERRDSRPTLTLGHTTHPSVDCSLEVGDWDLRDACDPRKGRLPNNPTSLPSQHPFPCLSPWDMLSTCQVTHRDLSPTHVDGSTPSL